MASRGRGEGGGAAGQVVGLMNDLAAQFAELAHEDVGEVDAVGVAGVDQHGNPTGRECLAGVARQCRPLGRVAEADAEGAAAPREIGMGGADGEEDPGLVQDLDTGQGVGAAQATDDDIGPAHRSAAWRLPMA